jgi:hypothetical protein
MYWYIDGSQTKVLFRGAGKTFKYQIEAASYRQQTKKEQTVHLGFVRKSRSFALHTSRPSHLHVNAALYDTSSRFIK